MTLKVIHINREANYQERAAKEFWENVLKPKWEARGRERAEKLFAGLKAGPSSLDPDKKRPKMK